MATKKKTIAKDDFGNLNKREYFSAMAMQGMLSGHQLQLSKEEADLVAMQSIQFADALIDELNKTP